MLVLSRKVGEKILVGDSIVVTVLEIRGDRIRLGLDAPRDVTIMREEVLHRDHTRIAAMLDSDAHEFVVLSS